MSEFEGNKFKVRCVDCTHSNNNRCLVKDVKIAPKKKRLCSSYEFKGAYENRTTAESTYIPFVNKKTKQAIKRLMKLGIVPVSESEIVPGYEGFAKTKTLPMPKSTAVLTEEQRPLIHTSDSFAATNVIIPVEQPDLDEDRKEDKLIWVPGDE